MIKAMVEYKRMVLNPSMKWLVKYWKGYTAFCVLASIVTFGWICRDEIKDTVKSKFKRKES